MWLSMSIIIFFKDLLGHHGGQPLLLGVEQNGVHHPVADDQPVKGPADEVGDPQLKGPLDMAGPPLRRNHDDGNVLNPVVLVHHVQHAEAVHFGHNNIQQHQGDLLAVLLKHGHGFLAVLRFQDVVLSVQHI